MRGQTAVFAPAVGAVAEDDGWLLTVVTDHLGRRSELLVCGAREPSGPPAAVVELPRAVPAGFHGSWITDEERAR